MLSRFDLRLIGVVAMVTDHIGHALCQDAVWMRVIGRLAFPIFAWCVSESMKHTRNKGKYLKRLLILGVVSQVAWGLYQGEFLEQSNVIFTLLLGAVAIAIWHYSDSVYLRGLGVGLCVLVAVYGRLDYGLYGVLSILGFYVAEGWWKVLVVQGVIVGCWGLASSQPWLAVAGMFGSVLVILYDGREGRKAQGFFYGFYPGHLIGIGGLAYLFK